MHPLAVTFPLSAFISSIRKHRVIVMVIVHTNT